MEYEPELVARITLGFMGGVFMGLIFLNLIGFVW